MSYTDQDFEQTAASHTPGPWRVGDLEHNRRGIDPGIGEVYGNGRTPDANARLIAAAPDLLAACESIRNWSEAGGGDDNDEIEAAMGLVRRAIAKATQP